MLPKYQKITNERGHATVTSNRQTKKITGIELNQKVINTTTSIHASAYDEELTSSVTFLKVFYHRANLVADINGMYNVSKMTT
jgi:hypothetical protein